MTRQPWVVPKQRWWDRPYDAVLIGLLERLYATKMLLWPDEKGAMYVGRWLRAKAYVLIWMLPIRWNYPECRHCDQVCGYNESRSSMGEYDTWDATFLAIPMGWHLGRAHIYRDGGP
jgi:hypothetical protein